MGFNGTQRHQGAIKKIEMANRRKLVAANLLGGATYAEIAAALNVSKSTIAADVKSILADWREAYADTANRYLHIQYRRLDILLNAIWDSAIKGDKAAIDRVLSVMDRQNTLMGLDKRPVEYNQTHVTPIQIVEINRNVYPETL